MKFFSCLLLILTTISSNLSAADRIVAVVNSMPITEHDFLERKKLVLLINRIPAEYQNNPEINKGILESLISDSLWAEQAKATDIDIQDSEIKSAISNIEKNNKMPAGHLLPYLESNGISKETFLIQIRSEVIKSKISRHMIRSISVSETEVEKAVIASNQKPVSVKMKVFTAKKQDSSGMKDLKNLSRKLNKIKNCDLIREGLYKNISSIQEIESTIDQLDSNIGHGFAMSLNVGEASEPFKVADDYKIVMICDRKVLDISKDETNHVLNILGTTKLSHKMQKYYENMRKRASVKINI